MKAAGVYMIVERDDGSKSPVKRSVAKPRADHRDIAVLSFCE
jgi:hypothetical protein